MVLGWAVWGHAVPSMADGTLIFMLPIFSSER